MLKFFLIWCDNLSPIAGVSDLVNEQVVQVFFYSV